MIDCNNNYTSLIHGHAHPEVVAATLAAVQEGTAFGLPTEKEIQLAELLSSRFDRPMQWRFTNSGSEAVMMAIRAARAVTKRDAVLRITGAYHGTYDQVVSSGAPGVPRTVQESSIFVAHDDEAGLHEAFERYGERIAAILVDLMPNRVALRPVNASFAGALRREADAAGALLIVDEVISYRLAPAGLQKAYGLVPDLTTVGKIIGGGFPVGAVGGHPDIMARFDPEQPASIHWSGTFSANPVTMAAGIAALSAYGDPEITRLNQRGEALRSRLAGRGLTVSGHGSLVRTFPDQPDKTWWELYHRGVLTCTNGLIALSTAMTDEQIEIVESTLLSVLA